MSSNKIRRIEDNYRRDSFEDRVCDDLCEVLLQFLPIKDKFKFECVSKQFQRNVFQRQYHFDLRYCRYFLDHNITETLGKLMKKLPNIESLKYFRRDINDSDIDLIVKYCHKLRKIDMNCDFRQISEEKRDSFAAKFGQNLVSIKAKNGSFEWIGKAFPKLEERFPKFGSIQ